MYSADCNEKLFSSFQVIFLPTIYITIGLQGLFSVLPGIFIWNLAAEELVMLGPHGNIQVCILLAIFNLTSVSIFEVNKL